MSQTLQLRAAQAVTALTLPAKDTSQDAWFPFSSSRYSESRVLGDFGSEAWRALRQQTPEQLVPVNPFEAGTLLPRVWEAAIALPACQWRQFLVPTAKPGPLRNTNTGFMPLLIAPFAKAGPTMAGWRRARSPYILDLVARRDGWQLFELAHVLAHLEQLQYKPTVKISDLVRAWLAKIVVCLRYQLPLLEPGAKLDSAHAGCLRIITGTQLHNPIFKIPTSGPGCLVPPTDKVCVFVAVLAEGLPKGFRDGSKKWTAATRWCCAYTQAAITGWECVDVVTHMPVWAKTGAYVVHGMDLQTPETVPDVLALAPPATGLSVADIMASEPYKRWYNVTPPLPAADCLIVHNDDSCGFIRPLCKRPEGKLNPALRDHAAWLSWEAGLASVRDLVTAATSYYETRCRIQEQTSHNRQLRRHRQAAWNKLRPLYQRWHRLRGEAALKRKQGWLAEARKCLHDCEEIKIALQRDYGVEVEPPPKTDSVTQAEKTLP